MSATLPPDTATEPTVKPAKIPADSAATTEPLAPELGNIPRSVIHRQLQREVRAVRERGPAVQVIAPDARLRHIMGMNSMDLARRPAVARAAREYTMRLVRSGWREER